MKQRDLCLFTSTLALVFSISAYSREAIGTSGKKANDISAKMEAVNAACSPATQKTDLDINNVRTTIMNGGDMWWELTQVAKYEIPKGSGSHSLFAGALWIGGLDDGGELKVAAMTYRQGGVDFWPGPLDLKTASTDAVQCAKWDRIYKVTRKEVDEFVLDPSKLTPGIKNWPGNGGPGQDKYMAPYFDSDGDGVYNAENGDYPDYDITGTRGCNAKLFGDQTLFWVFNDKGNIHTESGATPIGLEIHAQAFAFATNDEINNMTFYSYKIINRSSYKMDSTYFGQWMDPDLGCADDDLIGCDVARGLAYAYNGDAFDEDCHGIKGYGSHLASIGLDFFQGPIADANDHIDNNRNGVVDEEGEQIIMSKFMFYRREWTLVGEPENKTHYYNYMRGIWKDGTPIQYGGSGHLSGGKTSNFMFPGDTDPNNSTPWYDPSPFDGRCVQSAGKFTLQPGAVNTITTGAVWAQINSGSALDAVKLMKIADDKAQALFNNCFKVLDGPDAPDMTIQELNKEILISLTNKPTSNNYLEKYKEVDPLIIDTTPDHHLDKEFKFEGYLIYQLKDRSSSVTDLHNPDKARLVAQFDIKNKISQLVNFSFDPITKANAPVEEVNGANLGILHSLKITEDQFALGDKQLVNNKQYYFVALSYAYNNYKEYNQLDPLKLDGQKQPFKAGRRNIEVKVAIPHNVSMEGVFGTKVNTDYGSGPKLTRIEGQGNGGNILELTDETIKEILANGKAINPTYKNGYGPVNIKVIDPLNVPNAEFTFKLNGINKNATWTLTNETTGESVNSETNISVENEQLILPWGLSVIVKQAVNPGDTTAAGISVEKNGLLTEGIMEFADPAKIWLGAIADGEGESPQNWIRSGTYASKTGLTSEPAGDGVFDDFDWGLKNGSLHGGGLRNYVSYPDSSSRQGIGWDDNQDFEKILGGTWAPYRMCAYSDAKLLSIAGPQLSPSLGAVFPAKIKDLASVDIVITADKTKWTRCPVIEMQEEKSLAEGGVDKFGLRAGKSRNKEGIIDEGYDFATGMSWFPGYAVNLETGERLNMAFGEDSFLGGEENGKDMMWNPSANLYSQIGGQVLFGGKHYIYVFGHNSSSKGVPAYDAGKDIRNKLSSANLTDKKQVYWDAMWVNLPVLIEKHSLLETDVKIKLRVSKSYQKGYAATAGAKTTNNPSTTTVDTSLTPKNNNWPMYTFNTSDIAVGKEDIEVAKSALDLINVVPNPYYAYSAYEGTTGVRPELDNRIRVTNLPEKCTVSFYSINGTLIRVFNKDDSRTFLDWDLKNQAGVPVAGGMYLIHIDAGVAGQRVIKWFGVMRPIDLESF